MQRDVVRARARGIALVLAACVVIGMIIWLDIATGFWSNLVILSGLAAGLVTFLLTVLVLDRIIARSTARRWEPVNHLALSEFLHAIADEEHSEISRGHIVARSLPTDGGADLHALRAQVMTERRLLADVLSRWAPFLASSGDNERILRHVADIALQLDRVRDATLEAEETPGQARQAALDGEIQRCNEAIIALEAELRGRLTESAMRSR